MNRKLNSFLVILAVWAVASVRAEPAKTDLVTLAGQLQKTGASVAEADVIRLLTMAHDAGSPFQAAGVVKAYLGRAVKPSPTVLLLAAENAWLTVDYRTAVTRYKAYLREAPAAADPAVLARMVSIQIDFLKDSDDAYRSIGEFRGRYRSPAVRRFDSWFLAESRQRSDIAGMGRLLSVAFSEQQAIDQERYYYWEDLDWMLGEAGKLSNPGEVGGVLRELAGRIRDDASRAARCTFLGTYLEFRAGKTTDVGPSLAAAKAWFDVNPTAERLRAILTVLQAGGATEWEKQVAAKKDFVLAAFGRLSDGDRGALMQWPYIRAVLTSLQWTELAGKCPVAFRNPANVADLSFYVPNADAATIRRQAVALAGVPNRSAAVLSAATVSDDFAACWRSLVTKDGYYLPAQEMSAIVLSELWPAYRTLHADNPELASDMNQAKALASVGGELIASTPVALFDVGFVRAYIEAVWQTSPALDKNQGLSALQSLEWVPWSEPGRSLVMHKNIQRLWREYEKEVTASKDPKAEIGRSQLPALKGVVERIQSGSAVDPAKAPNSMCRGVAEVALGFREGNVDRLVAGARMVYPLVKDYDVKKTPYGATVLPYILQTPAQKTGTAAFHAEVIADQASQLDLTQWPPRFQMVISAMGSRFRKGVWTGQPKEAQGDMQLYHGAFGKVLLDMNARNQFSPQLFDFFGRTRSGQGWSSEDLMGEVVEKLIASKVLLQTMGRPESSIRSATATYMGMVALYPKLAVKYPRETAFDDLFVEEVRKMGVIEEGYWANGGADKAGKVAGAVAKVLATYETLPLGYDSRPACSRELLARLHERALGVATPDRDALLSSLAARAGKTRFDEMALGRGWFMAMGGTAKRAEIFAKLDAFVQMAGTVPKRVSLTNLGLGPYAKVADLTDAEVETLRRLLCDVPPATWRGVAGAGDVGKLLLPALAKRGKELALVGCVSECWRVGVETQDGAVFRLLGDLAESSLREKAVDRALAISSAGLAVLGSEQSSDIRTALMTVRSQGLVSTGGAIPVERTDPRYPAYAAQAAFNAGNLRAAMELYGPVADKMPGWIKDFDPKFTIGLINENARLQQFERAETLAKALVPWLESAGTAVDAETRARLLIAYAGIAFERHEYPKARALYERIASAEEFNETRAKQDAELRITEVDRLTKQYDKALESLEKLSRRKDKALQTEAFYQLARLKYEQEDYQEARSYLNQVLARMPDHPDGRILEGNIDLKTKRLVEATEVKVGLTTSQRILVPGSVLKVRLEDQNLAVVGKADSIEIRVWTTSGDEELFNLVPFGDSRMKFEGSLATAMTPMIKGDRVLQVLGDDTVHYDFSDRFKKAHNISSSEVFSLTVATDSGLYSSSGQVLTKEEMAERELESILRQKLSMQQEAGEHQALSLARPPDQIRPGNKINIRVVDPDRNITAGKDKITVRAAVTSGDVVSGFELTETETHSGVFEGALPTVAAQAMAMASDSEEGKQPNFPISAGNHPAWVGLANNLRPRLYSVDLHDNVNLGKLAIRADVPGHELKRFLFQTSLNGRDFTTLAGWPEAVKPWDGALTLSFIKPDKAALSSIDECRAAIQKARPVTVPVKALSVAMDQHLAAAGLGAADSYVAHLQGAFYLDTRQSRAFRLETSSAGNSVRYLFAVDGVLAKVAAGADGRGGAGPLEIRKSFAKGVHRLDVYVVAAVKDAVRFNVQWDIDKEPYIATCPAELFDPAVHPEIKQEMTFAPATVTPTADGKGFDVAFPPKSQARVFRLILEDFQGDAPAITSIQLADAAGKGVLPTQQDLTTLKDNKILELIPGDKVVITYEDPRVISSGDSTHSSSLVATYMNATINICFPEYGAEGAGAGRQTSYIPVRRFLAGTPVAVVINDPDRDTTDKEDTVQFAARVTGGKEVTFSALETREHSGVFVGNIFPVATAPQRATELQIRPADDITVVYVDAENTDPGVPWERTAMAEQAIYIAPKLRAYDVTSIAVGATTAVNNASGKAGAGDSAARGSEWYAATRSLVAACQKDSAGDAPARALLDGPVFVEVVFPPLALSGQSRATLYVQTSSGRKNAGDASTNAFDITVPGTIKLTAGPGGVGGGMVPPGYAGLVVRADPTSVSPLDDGRFGFSIPMKLGDTPASSLVGAADATGKESPVLSVRGGDEIIAGFEYKDEAGRTQWLTRRVILGSDSWFDVLDRKYMTEVSGCHVGENIYLRVMDKSKDVSGAKNDVEVRVTTSSGGSKMVKLTETFENTGVFKGHLSMVHVQDQSDTNNPVYMPVQYGDTVTLTYQSGEGVPALTRQVLVYKGADGSVLPFSKRFKDPEIAVQTQFTIAESYFELAKKHRDLKEESLARREIAQGKKVLEEVLRDYPDTSAKSQADYLLANLSLELANSVVDETAKRKHYMEAIGRFTDIIAGNPDSQHAPKAQFKKALTFEKMGEIDQACEEYVKLAYRYPDNELVAETMARLGQYFSDKGKSIKDKAAAETNVVVAARVKMEAVEMFRTAAQVFGRLAIRFEEHKLAGRAGVLAGTCYIRAEDYDRAVASLMDVIDKKKAEPSQMAEAMYWCGDAHMKASHEDSKVNAYRMFKRLTWDYPESVWAKYARGRLSESALAGMDKGDGR